MRTNRLPSARLSILIIFCSSLLFASSPRVQIFNSKRDFERGKAENLSILHDGKLTIAPGKQRVIDTGDPFIWDTALDKNGNIFLGTGNDGRVYRITAQGDSSIFFDAPELLINAVVVDNAGNLYVASSPNGKIYRITPDGQSLVFYDPEALYIWDLLCDDQGNIYAATGEKASVLRLTPDGAATVILESPHSHIRCLAMGPDNIIYAGSSGNGYIYKLTPHSRPFVVFDTQMEEVNCILITPKNDIFASAYGEPLPVSAEQRAQQKTVNGADQDTNDGGDEVKLAPQSIIPERFLPPQVTTSLFHIDEFGYARDLWIEHDEKVQTLLNDDEDEILIGSGNNGKLLRMTRDGEVSVVLSTKESQITALVRGANHEIIMGTSNMGRCYRLGPDLSKTASYESEAIDTGMLSHWGTFAYEGSLNDGKMEFHTRSGNTEHPDDTWSTWTKLQIENTLTAIPNPPARFLQWKCVFSCRSGTPPELDKVTIFFQQQNLAPEVTQIVIHKPGEYFKTASTYASEDERATGIVYPKPLSENEYKKGYRSVDWLFEDPNFDGLLFDLHYRMVGQPYWKKLATDLQSNVYSWDSSQMEDGEYQIKVIASDKPGNPLSRAITAEKISELFIIDNTGPVFSQFEKTKNNGLSFSVSDRWSFIKSCEYSIDTKGWMLLDPSDGINDSKQESFEIEFDGEENDRLDIAIRVTDSTGNTAVSHTSFKGKK